MPQLVGAAAAAAVARVPPRADEAVPVGVKKGSSSLPAHGVLNADLGNDE